VKCKDPAYGRWGGPPGNEEARSTPTAAKGLALAPRGKVTLRKAVRSPVPLLGIPASPPPAGRRESHDRLRGRAGGGRGGRGRAAARFEAHGGDPAAC
jgi:hypothetical protein